MAEVFLARQAGPEGFEKLVVLKKILPWLAEQPRFVQKFLNEARIAAGLQHPHIVDIYEVGEDHGEYFIAMEFLNGQDLRRIGRAAQKARLSMPLGAVLRIVVDAAGALHYAHSRSGSDGAPGGVVHRDVSPHNVLVTYDGATKVLDFGIARAVTSSEEDTVGAIEGKLAYMSPEQVRGDPLDARSDQFSLGILLYELTTGERLFRRDTDFSTQRAVEAARVPRPASHDASYPAELEEIVLRALALDPADRYPDCQSLARALSELAESKALQSSSTRLAEFMEEVFDERTRGKLLDPEHWNLQPRPASVSATASVGANPFMPPPDEAFEQNTGSITLSRGSLALGAPTGVVTLVFTDIEGSTALWEHAPDAMREALQLHNQLLRDTLHSTGGYEVKTEGDAFMVAFATPLAALEWAVRVQTELLDLPWPEALDRLESTRPAKSPQGAWLYRGLRLRMGIHTGTPDFRPDPRTTVMDYFGPDVNRAARVCAAAHGGQIVFSTGTWERLQGERSAVEKLAEISELGEHHLKGLASPEGLLQAVPRGLGRTFSALRATRSRTNNLPASESTFVGRVAEIETLDHLRVRARLVTIVGPAGTGKTRLAMELGRTLVDTYSGGVWVCDLTEVSSMEGICNAVAHVLGVPLMGGASGEVLAEKVGGAISSRGPLLLVLDNFEHVVGHARATVGRWLEMTEAATFVATSRVPLKIAGEQRYELGPLAVPEAGQSAPAEVPAVQLFVERARGIRHGFELSDEDAEVVAEIVRRLDGIPLAIELAAARVNVIKPRKILARLDQRFRLLTRGDGTGSKRARTLLGAIDWSWQLLSDWEQSALAQCSVFRGGFSLEAAEDVLDLSGLPDAPWALDIIQSLREKSLLRTLEVPDFPDEPRFGMYESIREYAGARLREMKLTEQTEQRHAAYYLGVAAEWAERATGRDASLQLARTRLEMDNLLAVHQRALGGSDADAAQRAVKAVLCTDALVRHVGPMRPHLERLKVAMSLPAHAQLDAGIRLDALRARGAVCVNAGELDAARADFEAGMELAREVGDRSAEAGLCVEMSHCGYKCGDAETTRTFAERAVEIATELSDDGVLARAYNVLGIAWGSSGHFEKAIAFYQEAVRHAEATGNLRRAASSLGNIAINYNLLGRFEHALENFDRTLELARETGNRATESVTFNNKGFTQLNLNDVDGAMASFTNGLNIARSIGLTSIIAESQVGQGECLRRKDDLEAAFEAAQRGLQVAEEGGYRVMEAMALRVLGQVVATGKLGGRTAHTAEQLFEKSIEVVSGTGERNELAESMLAYSEYLASHSDASRARRLRWEALELFESLGMQWRVNKLREADRTAQP